MSIRKNGITRVLKYLLFGQTICKSYPKDLSTIMCDEL